MTRSHKVARRAREAARRDPRLRIVLCGLSGEHEMPGWKSEVWRADGETMWWSPSCQHLAQVEMW
jgi:hypothetical protein